MHADQAKPEATDLFAAGDYSFWSRIFEPASQSLVEAAHVGAGGRVLDVAAGNGNTALAASRHGAIVTALDPSQAQIERGRQRAKMENTPIAWVRADGRRLPFADSSFDGCLDSFGDEMPSQRCSESRARAASLGSPNGPARGSSAHTWSS